MNTKKNTFNVFYDKGADILYLSQGKPSTTDETSETSDEIVVRKNKDTGEVKGLTILHFLKRGFNKKNTIALPFNFTIS